MVDIAHAPKLRTSNVKLVSVFWDDRGSRRPRWKAAVGTGSIVTHYDLPGDIPEVNRTQAERKAKAFVRQLKKEAQS